MSRVFEALRKSEGGSAGDSDFFSTESFFRAIENTSGEITSATAETAVIRPEARLAVWDSPHTLAADRYRRLRLHLEKVQQAGRLRTLLVTSASPQDGKTTVALNLATILAGRGKNNVLLIEADLRCPSIAHRLGLAPGPGLGECLVSGLGPATAVRRIEPLKFNLLPAGKAVADPAELLQSETMTQILQLMAESFDWIILDSPPAGPAADTLALKPKADAGLLVARSGQTSCEAIEEIIRQFGPGFVIGIILNAIEHLDREHVEYYRKYYRGAQVGKLESAGKRSA